MDNWHERFKTMKKELGLTNSDIADITGNSAGAVIETKMNFKIKVEKLDDGGYMASVDWSAADGGQVGTPGRYLTRKNKDGKYDIYLSGFCPMYCATYDTKEECKEHIKNQKKYYKEQGEK